MAWTDADLKIFAAGLAIGGEWNSRIPGESMFETPINDQITVNSIFASDISTGIQYGCIVGNITEE